MFKTDIMTLSKLVNEVVISNNSDQGLYEPQAMLRLDVSRVYPHLYIKNLLKTSSPLKFYSTLTNETMIAGESLWSYENGQDQMHELTTTHDIPSIERILAAGREIYRRIKVGKTYQMHKVFTPKDLHHIQPIEPKVALEQAIAQVVQESIMHEVSYSFSGGLPEYNFAIPDIVLKPKKGLLPAAVENAFDGEERMAADQLVKNYLNRYVEDFLMTVFDFVSKNRMALYTVEVHHEAVMVYRYADVRVYAYEKQRLEKEIQEQE